MAGRHRMRFADARNPRGLRPLTVIALCSVVAVLAVLLTQTVHPQGAASGGASVNSAGQGNTAPAATDPGTADQSDDFPHLGTLPRRHLDPDLCEDRAQCRRNPHSGFIGEKSGEIAGSSWGEDHDHAHRGDGRTQNQDQRDHLSVLPL